MLPVGARPLRQPFDRQVLALYSIFAREMRALNTGLPDWREPDCWRRVHRLFLAERVGFWSTGGWGYSLLSESFLPALLLGTALAIIGSFLDRKGLSVARARGREMVCWAVSGISFLLLVTAGNVHGWTFMFIFPTFAGFVAGAVFLSKFIP